MRPDLGTGDAPETPLADKARGQEVPVQAQVEFQGLPFVVQLIESGQFAPGGGRAPVESPVREIVGQEGSALVDLDGMDDVAAGALWEEREQWLPAGSSPVLTPLSPLDTEGGGGGLRYRTPAGSGHWCPAGTAGDRVKVRVRARLGEGQPGRSGARLCPSWSRLARTRSRC